MLEQAQSLAQKRGLTNIYWQKGDIELLPFTDDSFSIVLSRYAFHHFLNPDLVLSEMVRVCRPGGRILIADASLGVGEHQRGDEIHFAYPITVIVAEKAI
jgi:ubiquinone/menaquinone biosynthesis C-methylase UbiE